MLDAAEQLPDWLTRLLSLFRQVDDPVELFGVRFPNRVGLAAGFDKNGRFIQAAAALGFGHLEVGTVTPRPQSGHPRPRVWRHPELQAVRNKMGFPNLGAAALARRLGAERHLAVGVNLGKAATTPLEQAWRDYQSGFEALFPLADYFVVNVSSPNTAGLRSLQTEAALRPIWQALGESNQRLSERLGLKPRAILLKVSPDEGDLEGLAEFALSARVDGWVATNTTLTRPPGIPTEGGLSGAPLTLRSRQVVARLRELCPGMPIVGVGGVMTSADAVALRAAGADLVQLYTGFIYAGPGMPKKVAKALADG